MILRTSTSHEEGVDRHWSIMTQRFAGTDGRVSSLETVDVRWEGNRLIERPDSVRTWAADLVLLAIGYSGPDASRLTEAMDLRLDERGNLWTDSDYATSVPGVFAAGDARRGQSIVVWAISEGREAARAADAYLSGFVALPTKGVGDLPRK